jgi:hypothetical protein
MTLRAGHAAALLLLGLGACSGGGDEPGNNSSDDIVITTGPEGNSASGTEIVAVKPDGSTLDAAATPMKDREAVLGILNKRNGEAREFKLKPGQAARIGEVIVRLRACERTAPWELDQLTGAFAQVDVQQLDKSWRRVFSGWLYKERPALNVVQHPIYDVWVKSCAMTFKESGPDTVPAPGAGSGGGNRSSAEKSAETGEPKASPPAESPSAAPSNAT